VIAAGLFLGPGWLPGRKVRIRKEGSKKMSNDNMIVAGIDTAKDSLVVCILPGEVRRVFGNGPAGIAALVELCRGAGVVRAGIEATSIYHRAAMKALRAAGIEVAELQPRQVKGFAQAVLRWSKSDPIDAHVIARLTQVIGKVRSGHPENIEALAESLTYIEQLEERGAQLKTSLERFGSAAIKAAIKRDIKAVAKRRKKLLEKLEAELCEDPALRGRFELLVSIPGLGPRTALGFLIRMPELGSMRREETASLAGLAPHLFDTGKFQGERHIYGGRARLRKTAFLAAFSAAMHWNADLKRFRARLLARGKTHTAAVTACARKLVVLANAILARGTPWKPKPVMP
jgi:transposase